MTKYAHKTSLWATGHASSNNDNLLYLELVQMYGHIGLIDAGLVR